MAHCEGQNGTSCFDLQKGHKLISPHASNLKLSAPQTNNLVHKIQNLSQPIMNGSILRPDHQTRPHQIRITEAKTWSADIHSMVHKYAEVKEA